MTNLSVLSSDIDLPLRVVSYRERPSSTLRLLLEPRPRYDHRKFAARSKRTAKRTKPYRFAKDILWKTVMENLPEEFLQFFFPSTATGRSPSKKIEFLDKELLQLFPPKNNKFAPRRVDKLMKVTMRDGSTVTLHCEIQGYRQPDFSPRMYRYHCRLWDKFPQRVKAIAILTDGDRGFRPGPYQEIGDPESVHRLCYHYEVYKVLDQSEDELEQSENLFAMVILITKAAIKRKNEECTEDEYFQRKLELLEWLKSRSVSEEQEQALLSFLKYYMPFKRKTLETKFENHLNERSKAMGIVDYLINEAKEVGIEQGLEQGLEQGRTEAEHSKDMTFVQSLIRNTDHDDEEIADLAGVDVNFVKKVQAELQTRMVVN